MENSNDNDNNDRKPKSNLIAYPHHKKIIENSNEPEFVVIPADKLKQDTEDAIEEYEEYKFLKNGFAYLKANIKKIDPKFFDVLDNPEYGGSGWDLMLSLMQDGFKYRNIPDNIKEAIE